MNENWGALFLESISRRHSMLSSRHEGISWFWQIWHISVARYLFINATGTAQDLMSAGWSQNGSSVGDQKGIMVKVSSLFPDINTDRKEGISLTPSTSTRRQDISSLFPPSWWALIQEGSVGCWPARNYQFIWWADHHQSDTVSSTITEHSIHTMRRR